MATVELIQGDCLEVMKTLPECSVDSIVTDPPYGLSFMGKHWDHGVPGVAFWVEALRVAKPGAHLLAFGGTRTFHRLAVAIEDAGWEIRDTIMWVYGSGFPKSLNIGKAIDKMDASEEQKRRRLRFTAWVRSTGVTSKQIDNVTSTNMGSHYTTHPTQPAIMTREHLEQCRHLFKNIPEWVEKEADIRSVESKNFAEREIIGHSTNKICLENLGNAGYKEEFDITAPATPEAQQWEGWGTALKPAHEPVLFCAKPLTIEQMFGIIVEDITSALKEILQCKNLFVKDVEKNFKDIQARLEKGLVHTVHENAKTNVWENTANAKYVVNVFISNERALIDQKKMPPNSVQSSVREYGCQETLLEKTTHLGQVDNILTKIQDMYISVITEHISENTALLWKNLSEDLLDLTNTYTIKTGIKLITELRTLRSFLHQTTLNDTGGLYPNFEPVIMARKPIKGTVAGNVLEYGTGGLNIDASRVGTEDDLNGGAYSNGNKNLNNATSYATGVNAGQFIQPSGRWPANLIHDGSDEVLGLFPESKSGAMNGIYNNTLMTNNPGNRNGKPVYLQQEASSGSAARFFYCAKASRSDRNIGLDSTYTVKYNIPKGVLSCEEITVLVQLLQKATSGLETVKWNIGESGESITGRCQLDSLSTTLMEISKITTSQILDLLMHSPTSVFIQDANYETVNGGNPAESAEILSPLKLNTTKEKMELAHGVSLVVSQMLSTISDGENWKPLTNIHSTVKPTALMRYLCKLVTPPGGVVLDPFMGSGSTGKAAKIEGFSFVGIELEQDYIEIARRRIDAAKVEVAQPTLFEGA